MEVLDGQSSLGSDVKTALQSWWVSSDGGLQVGSDVVMGPTGDVSPCCLRVEAKWRYYRRRHLERWYINS